MSNASNNLNCNRSSSGRGNYDDYSDPDNGGRLNHQAGLRISRLGNEQTDGPPFVSGWITAPSLPFEGPTGEPFGQQYDAYPALRLPSSSQIRNGSLYLDLLSQGASEQEAYNTQKIHLILQLACVVIEENDE